MADVFELRINDDNHVMSSAELAQALAWADVVCPTVTDSLTGALLSAPTVNAKLLANFGVGFNHIDMAAASREGSRGGSPALAMPATSISSPSTEYRIITTSPLMCAGIVVGAGSRRREGGPRRRFQRGRLAPGEAYRPLSRVSEGAGVSPARSGLQFLITTLPSSTLPREYSWKMQRLVSGS